MHKTIREYYVWGASGIWRILVEIDKRAFYLYFHSNDVFGITVSCQRRNKI